MTKAAVLVGLVALAGCPYRTTVYKHPTAVLWQTDASGQPVVGPDGKVVFGKHMVLDRASAKVIDLATLAEDCDSKVIATIDEVRGLHGLNIFSGSHRSLEVWCGVVPAAPPAAAPPAAAPPAPGPTPDEPPSPP